MIVAWRLAKEVSCRKGELSYSRPQRAHYKGFMSASSCQLLGSMNSGSTEKLNRGLRGKRNECAGKLSCASTAIAKQCSRSLQPAVRDLTLETHTHVLVAQ
jgi:hypothetical protein